MNALIAGIETRKITPHELEFIEAPEATPTHQPIKHSDFTLEVETGLAMRGIQVTHQEYAVSPDGMRMFGVMRTNVEIDGTNFSVGLRNSNDKSMKLGLVAGLRILVCENLAFMGDFHGLTSKHTSGFNLTEACDVALGRIQRGMGSLGGQIQALKEADLSDASAEHLIYEAFVPKSGLRLPKQIMDKVHYEYFEPEIEDFRPRTAWSLHNAMTAAFKDLKPMRQFQETAKLTPFLVKGLGLDKEGPWASSR